MDTNIKHREVERLQFMFERDGLPGTIAFAEQGVRGYRAQLKQRNAGGHRCGYGAAYRRELVNSLIVYRRFLRTLSLENLV